MANYMVMASHLFIRKTFVCGSKYGLGIFGLFPNGEKQIGWIPEKDKRVFNIVERMAQHENFNVKLYKATAKRMTETFEKIEITIVCLLR